jgi:hypothetical protein
MSWIVKWSVAFLVIVGFFVVAYFFWTQFFAGESDLIVGSSATLECTAECAERGQCGTTVNSPKIDVILGGIDFPIVAPEQHNRFLPVIPEGTEVEIKETRSEVLEQISNGRQFDQTFSRVEWRNPIEDVQKAGWVADWCIRTN